MEMEINVSIESVTVESFYSTSQDQAVEWLDIAREVDGHQIQLNGLKKQLDNLDVNSETERTVSLAKLNGLTERINSIDKRLELIEEDLAADPPIESSLYDSLKNELRTLSREIETIKSDACREPAVMKEIWDELNAIKQLDQSLSVTIEQRLQELEKGFKLAAGAIGVAFSVDRKQAELAERFDSLASSFVAIEKRMAPFLTGKVDADGFVVQYSQKLQALETISQRRLEKQLELESRLDAIAADFTEFKSRIQQSQDRGRDGILKALRAIASDGL